MKKFLLPLFGLLLLAACQKDSSSPSISETGNNVESGIDLAYDNLSVNSRSLVYVNLEADNLIAYIQGLGLSSSVERAITRRLDVAVRRFGDGVSTNAVTSILNSIISYVTNQSGNHIPTADANYITAQIQVLVDAVSTGTAAYCTDGDNDGDGSTLDDIVLAPDCRSVQLRRERLNDGNGWAYTITLAVQDAAGNISYADYLVSVPVSGIAVNDMGALFSVSCF